MREMSETPPYADGYLGAEHAGAYGIRTTAPGGMAVRVAPDRVVARAGTSD